MKVLIYNNYDKFSTVSSSSFTEISIALTDFGTGCSLYIYLNFDV